MTRVSLAFGVASAAVVALGLVTACSSFGSAEGAPDAAAGDDARTTTDAGSPDADAARPTSCDLSKPFDKPELVPSLVAPGHSTSSARPAGDFLYFVSDRHADAGAFTSVDVYRARFAGDSFTEITRLPFVSDPIVEDVAPTESADHLTLFLARGDTSSRRVLRSSRTAPGLDYPAALPLPDGGLFVPGASAESDPYLVGTRLYFTAYVGGLPALYVVDTATDAAAQRVAHSDSAKLRYPVVTADEKELYYIRYDVAGGVGVPYVARRSQLAEEFPTGEVASPLELPNVANVTVSALSANGCDLYLSANPNGQDGFVVFRARRAP